MNSYTRQERAAAVAPTLTTGLQWLCETIQPHNALVQPQGIGLPAVANRRFIFAPNNVGPGATVAVHVTTVQHLHGPDAPRDVLTGEELNDIAATLTAAHTGLHAQAVSAPGATFAHIQLALIVHPTLLGAVARYRAGCPRHHRPACGDIRNTQCSWFSDGFSRLLKPVAPRPQSNSAALAPDARREFSPNVTGLGAANRRRRERGAARTVAIAVEAIAVLSRRPNRRASAEQALRVLQLRVDHPELSLRELAAAHSPRLTKDSYAARLRRALLAVESQHMPEQRPRSTTAA